MGPGGQTRPTNSRRKQALIYVELVYAAISVAVAVPLLFTLGPVNAAQNGTSLRILGAAVLALGVGALAVVRDPVGNRVILVVQLLFTTLSGLALVWKLASELSVRALWLLVPLVVFIGLLVALAPALRREELHRLPASTPPQE
jgi:hypothetical protein